MTEQEFMTHFLKHKKQLEALLLVLLGEPHTAEDLFQDVAVIMIKKRNEIDSEGNFLAWGRAIAFNLVMDYRKNKLNKKIKLLDNESLGFVAGAFDEWEPQDFSERRVALRECVTKLPPAQRGLIAKRYEQNKSIDDLVTETGRNRGAVETALYRIRRALMKCIETKLRMGSSI
ncbi:MAG: sigma-70 family RNA polymerase sigma factor [Planctomycetota bacterium]